MRYDLKVTPGATKLSKNFSIGEFACKDGSNIVEVNPKLVKKLQQLRDKVGQVVHINSAYRTKQYNEKVGGVENSQHLLGNAADVTIQGYTPTQVAKLAEQVGFDGIGIYETFTHCDVRGKRARWNG